MILTICVAAGVPLYAQEGTDEPTEEAAPQADTPEERVLEEIVVTAQKRVESVQDVPISISAFSDDFFEETGIVDVAGMVAYTPGLSGQTYQDTESVFTIRGIGTQAFGIGADSSVGIFIDDLAVGRTSLAGSSFFDVERVEVVRGPQGTLFGRNTSAGAISIITKRPTTEASTMDLKLGVGNESQKLLEFVGNWAATDKFAARLSVRHDSRDGSLRNEFTGEEVNNRDHTNVRLGLSYDFTDNFFVDFRYERYEVANRTGATSLAGGFVDTASYDFDKEQEIQSDLSLLRFVWDISDSISLTSNTGYVGYDMTTIPIDADMSTLFGLNLFEPQEGSQISQEFRLNGGSGAVDWFIGASFYKEDIEASTTYEFTDYILTQLLLGDFTACDSFPCLDFAAEVGNAKTDNKSYAVYGDLAWSLSDAVTLTLGARYTSDKKDFEYNAPLLDSLLAAVVGDNFFKPSTNGVISDNGSWSSFDPRIALDFYVSDDVSVYASATSGYKAGGFNSGPDQRYFEPGEQNPAKFNEEKVTAYEVGLKSQFWGNRARINTAVFYQDYKDLQIENNEGLVVFIQNVADVLSKGVELDGSVLATPDFTIFGNYTWLSPEVQSGIVLGVDVTGNDTPRSPRHSGALGGRYTWTLRSAAEFNFRLDYLYTGEFFFDQMNTLKQDSYGVVNGMIGFDSANGHWGVAVIGENLTDEDYWETQVELLEFAGIPNMGRLVRAEFRVSF